MNRIRRLVRIAALSRPRRVAAPCRSASRSVWASSTATRSSRRFSNPTRRAWTSPWPRSTPRAACSADRSKSCRATTTATPATPYASPRSSFPARSAVLLMGTFASNVGLAVADLAKQRKVLFLAAEPLTDKIVWEAGNRYTFRLRASTYMQTAMLVARGREAREETLGDRLSQLRVRPSRHHRVQAADDRAPGGRHRVRRAGGAARQDRRRSPSSRRCSTPSPTPSSRRCSAPTSRASSAKANCAASSRAGRCSTCWAASPNTSIR